MRVSLIGLPGSGKTTLGKLMADVLNIMYVSSGDLARAHGFSGSKEEATGQLAKNEGIIRKLIMSVLEDSDAYILDGFPRTIEQVKEVDIKFDAILYLGTPDRIAYGRLIERGRDDDVPEIIDSRFKLYREITHPLVWHWEQERILIKLNASKSPHELLGEAVNKLGKAKILIPNKYINTILRRLKRGLLNN